MYNVNSRATKYESNERKFFTYVVSKLLKCFCWWKISDRMLLQFVQIWNSGVQIRETNGLPVQQWTSAARQNLSNGIIKQVSERKLKTLSNGNSF